MVPFRNGDSQLTILALLIASLYDSDAALVG